MKIAGSSSMLTACCCVISCCSIGFEATRWLTGSIGLLWQALSEQLGEGGNVGITGRKKSVRLLKSFQGALRGGPHFPIRNAGIVTGAFQFAL